MSLTVPRAGVIGGRAPQLASVPVPVSEMGAAVAGLGDRMLQVGTAIEEDRSQRELAQARITMMQGLNDLRLEFEQSGSPDDIDVQYPQRAEALKKTILGGLSARSQQGGAVMFDELQVTHGFALGKRAIDLRQSERMATTDALRQAVLITAATASDQPTRDAVLGHYDDHLRTMVANGTMKPAEAQRERMTVRAEADDGAATRMASTDPAGLIAKLDDPNNPAYQYLGPARREQLRAGAVADLAAAERQRKAETSRAEKERLEAARGLLKDGVDVYRAGGKGRDYARQDEVEEALKDPAVAALPEAREYVSAKFLHEVQPGFAALPMAEKRKLLAAAEANPLQKGYDADLAQAMRSQIAADEEGFAKDPIGYAATIGLKATPGLPDPATSSAVDMGRALQARAAYAVSLQQSGYTKDARLFRPDEAEKFKAAVAITAPPEQRAQLSSALAAALGDRAEEAAAEIGADPVFGYVGGMLASGGSEQLARQIFDGQRVIAESDIKLPGPSQRRGTFFGKFGALFSDGTKRDMKDEAAGRDQIIAAADALYAWRERNGAAGNATLGMIDETKYAQAVHDVMGGTGTYGKSNARGGVAELRGRLTIMPMGRSTGEVEDMLDTVAAGGAEAWRTASATGNVPVAGGAPIGAGEFGRASLRWVEGSSYELVVDDPRTGGVVALWGDDGKPYHLDLSRIGGAQ